MVLISLVYYSGNGAEDGGVRGVGDGGAPMVVRVRDGEGEEVVGDQESAGETTEGDEEEGDEREGTGGMETVFHPLTRSF